VKTAGTSALATAYSLAASGTFLILILVGRRNFANFDFANCGKILLGSTILGALVFVARNFWTGENLLFEVGAIALAGGIFYLALARFWRLSPRNFC
jgi:hypothetical protein